MRKLIQIGKPLQRKFNNTMTNRLLTRLSNRVEKDLAFPLIEDLVNSYKTEDISDFMSLYIKVKHVNADGFIGWSAGRGVDVGHVFDE